MELIYDALASDSGAREYYMCNVKQLADRGPCWLAVELIVEKASGIESATYEHFGGTTAGYKSKIRSLFVNLKDKNNPGLRESIVSGEIPFEKLPTMTSEVRHCLSPTFDCLIDDG